MRIIPINEILDEVYENHSVLKNTFTMGSFKKLMRQINRYVIKEMVKKVPIMIGYHADTEDDRVYEPLRIIMSSYIYRNMPINTIERHNHQKPKTLLKMNYKYMRQNYPYKFGEPQYRKKIARAGWSKYSVYKHLNKNQEGNLYHSINDFLDDEGQPDK